MSLRSSSKNRGLEVQTVSLSPIPIRVRPKIPAGDRRLTPPWLLPPACADILQSKTFTPPNRDICPRPPSEPKPISPLSGRRLSRPTTSKSVQPSSRVPAPPSPAKSATSSLPRRRNSTPSPARSATSSLPRRRNSIGLCESSVTPPSSPSVMSRAAQRATTMSGSIDAATCRSPASSDTDQRKTMHSSDDESQDDAEGAECSRWAMSRLRAKTDGFMDPVLTEDTTALRPRAESSNELVLTEDTMQRLRAKTDGFMEPVLTEDTTAMRPRAESSNKLALAEVISAMRPRAKSFKEPVLAEDISAMRPRAKSFSPTQERLPSMTSTLSECVQAFSKKVPRSGAGRKSLQSCSRHGPHGNIEHLDIDETIEDRFFCFSKVLQEDGNGGKVVVARRRACTTDVNREDGGEEKIVLKVKAKETFADNEDENLARTVFRQLLAFPPHPCINQPREVLEDDGFFYSVMPHLEGGPLLSGLRQRFSGGAVPENVMKLLMRNILEAVGHVHEHGMLHRDIRPGNIVLTEEMRAVLTDFDHADTDWGDWESSQFSSFFVGAPRFAAPETFRGHFSRQSDLYSVGVVLYNLVVGRLPYDDQIFSGFRLGGPKGARSAAQDVQDLMVATPIDFGGAPWASQPACHELCQALLASAPGKRPSSAEKALSFSWFQCDA